MGHCPLHHLGHPVSGHLSVKKRITGHSEKQILDDKTTAMEDTNIYGQAKFIRMKLYFISFQLAYARVDRFQNV